MLALQNFDWIQICSFFQEGEALQVHHRVKHPLALTSMAAAAAAAARQWQWHFTLSIYLATMVSSVNMARTQHKHCLVLTLSLFDGGGSTATELHTIFLSAWWQ